jgi:paraquat-inducible protein A
MRSVNRLMLDAAADGKDRAEVVACPDCGARQRLLAIDSGMDALCWRCGAPLERAVWRSADAALACALAGFLLLIPGNLLPLMRSALLGGSIAAHAIDGAVAYWEDGWPLMAVFVTLFVVAIPLTRAAMLVAVLGTLRFGRQWRWQGFLFRYAEALRLWSMPAVYVLAGIVTYSRIAAELDITLLAGGWCFVAGAVLLLIGEASLDRRQIWQEIRRDGPMPRHPLACDACQLLLPDRMEGARCPRCGLRLDVRKPESVWRTGALTAAALVLYPAGLLIPMTRTTQPGGLVERNIIDGVSELFRHGFWYLGILLFTVSVAIPVLKIIAIGWMLFRVRYPREKRLAFRTKLHRGIHEINRWSFADPFIVALTAPLMAYEGIADVHTGPGALPFALVVVLTMLASQCFDTRLMWDAAEKKHD